MSEAGKITELEELEQKKESTTLKTHNEILDLFREIETIEEKVKNPDLIEEIDIQPEIVWQEVEETGEIADKKRFNIQFLSELRKKKELKEPKPKKHFLKLRKSKLGEIDETGATELQDQLEKTKRELKPAKSTFTLRMNDQGNLVGLNIKKPIPKKEKKPLRLKLFKKGAAKEATPAEPEIKGIKGIPGKIKGIFSKIKLKKSGEGKSEGIGSKISGITGKIKGIFSRKSK